MINVTSLMPRLHDLIENLHFGDWRLGLRWFQYRQDLGLRFWSQDDTLVIALSIQDPIDVIWGFVWKIGAGLHWHDLRLDEKLILGFINVIWGYTDTIQGDNVTSMWSNVTSMKPKAKG